MPAKRKKKVLPAAHFIDVYMKSQGRKVPGDSGPAPEHFAPLNRYDPASPELAAMLTRRLPDIALAPIFNEIGLTLPYFIEHIPTFNHKDERLASIPEWYRKLSAKKKASITIDDVCLDTNFSKREMFGVLSQLCYDLGLESAKRLVGLNIPKIVEQSILNAMMQGELSQEERREWLRALGLFNRPAKDTGTVIQINNENKAAAQSESMGLPAFEDTVGEDDLTSSFYRPAELPAAPATIDHPSFLREESAIETN